MRNNKPKSDSQHFPSLNNRTKYFWISSYIHLSESISKNTQHPIVYIDTGGWYRALTKSTPSRHQQTLFLAAVGCTGLWRHLKPTEERVYWLCRFMQIYADLRSHWRHLKFTRFADGDCEVSHHTFKTGQISVRNRCIHFFWLVYQ